MSLVFTLKITNFKIAGELNDWFVEKFRKCAVVSCCFSTILTILNIIKYFSFHATAIPASLTSINCSGQLSSLSCGCFQ